MDVASVSSEKTKWKGRAPTSKGPVPQPKPRTQHLRTYKEKSYEDDN